VQAVLSLIHDDRIEHVHDISGDLLAAMRREAMQHDRARGGPLDEAACSMLAQILAKRGLSSRIVSTEAVSRGLIDTLDVAGITMVCVSYLEAASSLSSLRYLMRRIHERTPGLPTMVGLWHVKADELDQDRLRAVIGADQYTTSLREAVATCVSWATMPVLENGGVQVVAA